LIEANGGKVASSVSGETTGVIVKDKAGKSSGKVKEAMNRGIQIYTREEFEEEFFSP